MRRLQLIFLIWTPLLVFCQSVPRDVNIIVVKNVNYNEVCQALLDANYAIDKKDNDLKTVRTEAKPYPKYWNATYVINVRVKDSSAYISGTFTGAGGEIFKNEPIYNHTNKKGETFPKSLIGYAFLLLNDFALSFKKELLYLKQ